MRSWRGSCASSTGCRCRATGVIAAVSELVEDLSDVDSDPGASAATAAQADRAGRLVISVAGQHRAVFFGTRHRACETLDENEVTEQLTPTDANRTLTYTAAFRFEDGRWWAQAVEVPEAFGQGRTLEEARANLADGLAAAVDARLADGEAIPPSGQVTVGPVTVIRS